MRMESVQHVGFLKLYSERWLLLYILFGIVVVWEVRRMMVIFRNRCPVRSSFDCICLLGLEEGATGLMLAKQNVRIAGGDSMVEKWITSIRYIYAAQSVHQKAYIDVRPSLFAT